MSNQNLFNLMASDYGLTLLESEMDAIKQAIKEDEAFDIGVDTGEYRHGKKIFKRQTSERTCKGCIFSPGGGRCMKSRYLKCMSDGKEYIFFTMEA